MERNDPACRILHCQAHGFVGVVHHEDGVDADLPGDIQAFGSVGEEHGFGGLQSGGFERALQGHGFDAAGIVSVPHGREVVL